ncbi:MAG TPA: hypothetical protein VK745_12560 [Polyangiaceae bacterium]|jgi:hypothetical protein|nr:hypothetical protein [Polyangiaceae bacterium]
MRSVLAVSLLLPIALLGSCTSRPHSDAARADATRVSTVPLAPAGAATCHDNTTCGTGEYCAFQPGLCGKGQSPGTCRARPAGCASGYDPVCACSSKVYDNACAAHAAGEDLAVMGGCNAVIPDFAPCGPRYCDSRESYCEIYLSDVFDLPTDHFCQPLPNACKPNASTPAKCDCFPKDTPCLSFCGPLATGGIDAFHLTCQGKKPPHS